MSIVKDEMGTSAPPKLADLDVFYPDGVGAWMARVDADTDAGGMTVDPQFFPHGDDFRGLRVHQARLQGGDASSDSYCFVE